MILHVRKRPTGMLGLTIVLFGQVFSIMASSMTGFALSIWIFQQTNSATSLGIMQSSFTLSYMLIIPVAGVLVDRYNRKIMMMISDIIAGLCTLAILLLFFTNHFHVIYFYLFNIIVGMGNAFQWPAYSAAIATMVPKVQYGRANGMISLVQAGPGIVAPLLAGALLPHIGLEGILLVNLVAYPIAVGALLLVQIPLPVLTTEGENSKGTIIQEAAFGFNYIFKRQSPRICDNTLFCESFSWVSF